MEKTALVLAGGGARGAYEIGVWQALRELDIPIHIVTGTSVGALNAAIIAMGDFENARSLWMNMKTDMIFDVDVDDALPEKQKNVQMFRQFLRDYARQGGVDSYPLKQLLDTHIDEQAVRESPVECGFVCVDKTNLRPLELYMEDIPQGMLTEYMVASSSLYPAIKSQSIGDSQFIDGGYYDNLPVELALERGASQVIAVDLEAVGMVRRDTLRAAENLRMIRSYWNLGSLLTFDTARQARNIRLGYLDAMKSFGACEGIAFAFIKGEFASCIRRQRNAIAAQNKVLGLEFGSGRSLSRKEELFFLRMSAFLRRKYDREPDRRYSSFLTACAESAGEAFGLDSEKLYSLERFNQRLLEAVGQVETEPSWTDRVSAKALRESLSLLDKTVRMVRLSVMIKRAAATEKSLDILGLSLFLPDELLGAYYLALIS